MSAETRTRARSLLLDLIVELASARDLAVDLAGSLDLHADLKPLRDCARDLLLGLALDLDRARGLNRVRARVRARVRGLALDLAIFRDLAHDHARNGDVARDFEFDLAVSNPYLVRALYHGYDLDFDLGRDLDLARDLARCRGLAGNLANVLRDSYSTIRSLGSLLPNEELAVPNEEVADGSAAGVSRRSRAAEQIVRWAAQAVPHGHRSRYEYEFRGDLAAIAEEGGGKWLQLICAARMLSRVLALRAALRDVPPELPERAGST